MLLEKHAVPLTQSLGKATMRRCCRKIIKIQDQKKEVRGAMLGRRAFDNGEGFRGEFGWLEREIVSRLERVAVFAVMMIAVFVLGTKNAFAKTLFISANEKSSLVSETILVAPQRPSRAFWEFGYSRVNGLRGRGGIEINDAPTPTPQPNKGAEGANSETISGSENDPLVPIIQKVQEKYPDVEFIVGHDQGAVSAGAIIGQLKSSGQWENLTTPQKRAVEALAESKKLNHELNSLDPEALSQVANDVLTILRCDSNHNRFMAPSGQSLTSEALNQKINELAKKDPALAEMLQEILQAVQSDTSMDWKNIRINTARFLQEKDPEKIRAFLVLLDIYRQWFKINGDPDPILHSLQITPFEVVPHGSVIAGSDLYFLTGRFAKLAFEGAVHTEFKSMCDPNSPDSYGGCQFCYGYPPGMFFFIPNNSGRVEKAVVFVQASGQLKGENGVNNYLLVDVIIPDGDVKTILIQSDIKNGPTPALALVKLLQDLYPKDANRIIYVVPKTDPRNNIGVAVNGNVHYPQIRLEWVQRILSGNSKGHSKETKEDEGQRSLFLQRFVGEIFKRAFLLQPR